MRWCNVFLWKLENVKSRVNFNPKKVSAPEIKPKAWQAAITRNSVSPSDWRFTQNTTKQVTNKILTVQCSCLPIATIYLNFIHIEIPPKSIPRPKNVCLKWPSWNGEVFYHNLFLSLFFSEVTGKFLLEQLKECITKFYRGVMWLLARNVSPVVRKKSYRTSILSS